MSMSVLVTPVSSSSIYTQIYIVSIYRAYSPRCSMSRKPVFLARTPRLVAQVIAQSTTPMISRPPAIL